MPWAASSSWVSEASPVQIQVWDGVSRIKTSSEFNEDENSPICSALISSGPVPANYVEDIF